MRAAIPSRRYFERFSTSSFRDSPSIFVPWRMLDPDLSSLAANLEPGRLGHEYLVLYRCRGNLGT